jgi:ABC-type transport system substrate-binding protein
LTPSGCGSGYTNWLGFTGKWDAKSPWHDRRVRLAANYAIDRQAINEAETLGFGKVTGSIIPHRFPDAKKLVVVSYFNAGVRVVDIRDPLQLQQAYCS